MKFDRQHQIAVEIIGHGFLSGSFGGELYGISAIGSPPFELSFFLDK
jgi:hypothetical protein